MAELDRLAREAVQSGDWTGFNAAVKQTGQEMRAVFAEAAVVAQEATAGLESTIGQPLESGGIDTGKTEDGIDRLEEITRNRTEVERESSHATLEERILLLQELLKAEQAYTDDWMDIRRDLKDAEQQFNDQIAREAENQYQHMVDQGNITLEQQIDRLEERLSQERRFSDEWMAIQREITSLSEQMHDAEKARIDELDAKRQAALEHEQMLADNRYEFERETGVITDEQHLKNLRAQLKGLEQYSDDWLKVWREIHDGEESINAERLKVQQEHTDELKRQYDEAQRQLEQYQQTIDGTLASSISSGFDSGDWQGASDSVADSMDDFILKPIDEAIRKAIILGKELPQMMQKVMPEVQRALQTGNLGNLRGLLGGLRTRANDAMNEAASISAQVRDVLFSDNPATTTITPIMNSGAVTAALGDVQSIAAQVGLGGEFSVTDPGFSVQASDPASSSAMTDLTNELKRISALQNVDMSGSTFYVRDDPEYEEFVEQVARDLRARTLL
jgi:hypothetical protein